MSKYIVKSKEEELGEDIYVIDVPNIISKETVMKTFEMASKYATMDLSLSEEEGIKEYDKHYDEMARARETSNGMYAFNYYITKICGWYMRPIRVDFEYEW